VSLATPTTERAAWHVVRRHATQQHKLISKIWPLALVLLPALPILFTMLAAFKPSVSFDHIASVLLFDMVLITVGLVGLSTFLAGTIGTGLAWLVTAYEFKGRGFLAWSLVLPLALPAYVSAYAWGDLAGVRGFGIAVLVYTTTLYPYIYLAARSAFEAQSVCALEAARVLGASSWRRFSAIALPMARPAIAAGAALAALEMTSDYGAADHLGVQTLTIGIFKAWFSMGDLAGAARLSSILLVGVLVLVWCERKLRTGSIAGGSTRWRTPTRSQLTLSQGFVAAVAGSVVLMVALIIPVSHLVKLGLAHGVPSREFAMPFLSTGLLCLLGAVVTLFIAAFGAFVARSNGRANKVVHTAALAGYATPGAVTALGMLALLSFVGHGAAAAALAGPAAIICLCYAYSARFTAAGLEPLSAGLEKSTRSMREAASTMGASPFSRFWRLEAPLAAPSAFAAALIVAIEIAKELPATTILRPFGLDTLAVRAHSYAADERLAAAAWPALAIVALALVPTLIFSHGLSKSRAGQS
jgi:iron(III) transport system permease protein